MTDNPEPRFRRLQCVRDDGVVVHEHLVGFPYVDITGIIADVEAMLDPTTVVRWTFEGPPPPPPPPLIDPDQVWYLGDDTLHKCTGNPCHFSNTHFRITDYEIVE